MAKMRGIKPETFTDDKVLQVDPIARWLFVGMWTQACDNGHVEDNPVQLKIRLLPMDNCDSGALITQLLKAGLITRHDGYLKIPNLPTHQKIDKRYLVFCKWCEHDPDLEFDRDDKRERDRSDYDAARRAPGGRTVGARRAPGDEGEGEGEGEGEKTLVDQDQPTLALVHPEPTPEDRFEEFWEAYPKRSPHANPKKPAREKFTKITKTVNPQILIDAAHSYAKVRRGQDPLTTAQAQTWLNQERWNDDTAGSTGPSNGRPQVPNAYRMFNP